MSDAPLLAKGLYRTGVVALLFGATSMYANIEGAGVETDGWTLVVIGLVVALNGAVYPLAEFGLRKYVAYQQGTISND